MYHIFCILWDLALLLLFLAVTGALIYVAFTLSSFAWPAVLFVLAAVITWALVR